MPFTFGNYVSSAAQIADGIIDNDRMAADFLSDTKGDVGLGANKLKTTNLLLKEFDTNRFTVKNAADAEYKGLVFGESLITDGDLLFQDGRSIRTVDATNAVALLLKSYDTAWQTVAKLLNGKFELALGKLTGALDCNSQNLTSPGLVDGVTVSGHHARHEGGGADELTGQFNAATMNSAGHITILPFAYQVIGAGTWTFTALSGQFLSGPFFNSSGADLDNITYNVYLAAGTYTLRLLGAQYTSSGIVDIDIDAAEVGSVDQYASSNTPNHIYTVTNISIAASGAHTIKVRVDGKNASSSGYRAALGAICLWRTA